jgi:hypothetical protein
LLHLQSLEADHPHRQTDYLLHLSTQSKITKTRLPHLLDLLNRYPRVYLRVLLDLPFHPPIREWANFSSPGNRNYPHLSRGKWRTNQEEWKISLLHLLLGLNPVHLSCQRALGEVLRLPLDHLLSLSCPLLLVRGLEWKNCHEVPYHKVDLGLISYKKHPRCMVHNWLGLLKLCSHKARTVILV